jgi:nucleoside-diphosphate-sugar epimerase
MKCLLTGVNGLVGRNLMYLLTDKYGFDIWSCGRGANDNSKYFSIDLMDRIAVLDLFLKNRFDVVIHCAANINTDEGFSMFRNNVLSTLNIVEASLSSGIEKIFTTSSVPVIGKILELPITEEHPTIPLSVYHLSKLHSEQIIEHYCKDRADFIIMRITSPVGRDMVPRSILPIFIEKIKNGDTVTLSGDSRRRQNFLDLRDLASFIYKASLGDGVSGVFNVAANKTYSDVELAEMIISRTGSNSKIINNMFVSDSSLQNWDVSTEKAKYHFGYVSNYNLDETVDWVI